MFEKTAEKNIKRDGGANEKTDKNNDEKMDIKSSFYRSQEEVDKAFKKRFASEKEKWDKEQEQKDKINSDEDKIAILLNKIESQKEGFYKLYPDVDIYGEIETNPLFAYLILSGKSVTDTYEFLYVDVAKTRLKGELEQEIIGNLKARNTRPRVINAANSGGSSKDIARLSDAEILRIDQRIKSGERVTL